MRLFLKSFLAARVDRLFYKGELRGTQRSELAVLMHLLELVRVIKNGIPWKASLKSVAPCSLEVPR